jgi:hypothetical protein
MGETLRLTLDLDEGTLSFHNVTRDRACGQFTGINPGTALVPYLNFDYTTSATILECVGASAEPTDDSPVQIAVSVLGSLARGHFEKVAVRLLAEPTVATLTACMCGSKGKIRRRLVKLVTEIVDGAERHHSSLAAAGTLLPVAFAGMLKLFEQSYAEATNKIDPKKSDIFGSESLAALSQLVVRLTKFGAFEAATLEAQIDAPELGPSVKSCVTFFDYDNAAATDPMLKVAGGKLAWWLQDAALLDGITELTLLRKPGGGLFMTATDKPQPKQTSAAPPPGM